MVALRQMDDKPGVPVLADLIASLRGRPLTPHEPAPQRGFFIAFEGGEGAGKSSQAYWLAKALRATGHDVVVTREPGATDLGKHIRRILLDGVAVEDSHRGAPGTSELTPRAEALLYAADRAHHVSAVIRPALARGAVVITDRYVDSSLAYQGAGRTLPVEDVAWLSTWATGGLKPDLVILLDIEPRIGLRRVGDRGAADRLESESLSFHERVRYAFLDLAAADSTRYLILDGTRPQDAIAAVIAQRVAEMLPPAPPAPRLDVTVLAEMTGATDGLVAPEETDHVLPARTRSLLDSRTDRTP
jgi:dTMP kinase